MIVDCYLDEIGGARNVAPHFQNVSVLRAAHDELPETLDVDGIIITGSAASLMEPPSWAELLVQRVAEAAERGVAVLGLCFGHQLLARALFGPEAVRRAPQPELGWIEIERCEEDTLFLGIDRNFTCFVSHKDEVNPDHSDFRKATRILAGSPSCSVEAFRVLERPLWGVQFHAEMQLEESRELVISRFGAGDPEAVELLEHAMATPELVDKLMLNFRQQVERWMGTRSLLE